MVVGVGVFYLLLWCVGIFFVVNEVMYGEVRGSGCVLLDDCNMMCDIGCGYCG